MTFGERQRSSSGGGRASALAALVLLATLGGCKDDTRISREKARAHVEVIARALEQDLAEVRAGLPKGAEHLAELWQGRQGTEPPRDLEKVRRQLGRARRRVQDLRVAKTTFFALADTRGVVLRNDQEQDRMAGKGLFGPFPALRKALEGGLVEALGTMPEASGVEGRPDAQWVAAVPVRVDGRVVGLYATGWSWSSYAYRLENAARTDARPPSDEPGAKMPLVYAFVVVGDAVYGAPVTPQVDLKAVADQKPLSRLDGSGAFSAELTITGRGYGFAARRVPAAGPEIGVAVLRSET